MQRSSAVLIIALLATAGMAEAKHYFNEFCTNPDGTRKSDATPLPPDPRSLAVHDNGFSSDWQDCHPGDTTQPDGTPVVRPTTCAEWWAFADEGKRILEEEALIGSIGFGSMSSFVNLWQAWGYEQAPDRETFERTVTERYGLQPAPFDNPFPYPGDDDCAQPEGCGQLPLGFVQTRNANGDPNGGLGITCLFCHASRIGEGDGLIGLGNNTFDAQLYHEDVFEVSNTPTPLPYPHNITRGSINAVSDFEFLSVVRDLDTLDLSPFLKSYPVHASPGDQDPPNWWNTGMRPRVYMDGGVSADSTRALMMFLSAKIDQGGEWIRNREQLFENIQTYIESIEPPAFPALPDGCDPAGDPRCIDEAKRAEGEALFHTLDLFRGNAPIGNGSCASCHGVYSDAYAKPISEGGALPDELATNGVPSDQWASLVGVAGQIVPLNVIGTDPGRSDALSLELRYGWGTTWWAYPDLAEGYTPPSEKDPLTEGLDDFMATPYSNATGTAAGAPHRVQGICNWEGAADTADGTDPADTIGYAAPALHGVWASAPYFHNGSVPTVWHVLHPQERPRVWSRPLSDGIVLPNGETEAGYSTSLEDYDFARLGWSVTADGGLLCGLADVDSCGTAQNVVDEAVAAAFRAQGSVIWHGLQWPAPRTREQIEARKVYDTRLYGKSNEGHVWPWLVAPSPGKETKIEAILEYLKTL